MSKLIRKSNKGFTLIELMIVVAIIGILAAIAIPNFLTMQLRAKRSEVPLNLSGIQTAEQAYFHEYGSYRATSALPTGSLNTVKRAWPASSGGFDEIGWEPDGLIYGKYQVHTVNNAPPQFTASGQCDVDNDNSDANYTATHQAKPVATTNSDVY